MSVATPAKSFLFVCLGNICRSPLAEGACKARLVSRGVEGIAVDSCGTGGWHVGEPPDTRSVATAEAHGVAIGHQRARQLAEEDYRHFDVIVAMDRDNYRTLVARAPANAKARLIRFMSLLEDKPTTDVPDPYYGGPSGFEDAWSLLSAGMDLLLDDTL